MVFQQRFVLSVAKVQDSVPFIELDFDGDGMVDTTSRGGEEQTTLDYLALLHAYTKSADIPH